LKNAAKELVKTITDVFQSLEKVRGNIKSAPEILNRTISSFDYGVSKNEQIVNLEVSIKFNIIFL
jgi:phage terminase large subunit